MIWLCALSLARGPTPADLAAPARDAVSVEERALTVQEALDALLRPDLRPAFRPPNEAELAGLRAAVIAAARDARRGQPSRELLAAAAQAGLRVERWTVAGRAHVVLLEHPDRRHGMGAYVFAIDRPASASLLLQSPHPYHDQRTGEIAATWHFEYGVSSAYFTSTLHRYTRADGSRKKATDAPADPCRSSAHPFDVATQAVARARPTDVVQLHGFASDLEGDDRPPAGTVVVLSGGRAGHPTDLALVADARIGTLLGADVRVYPAEVDVLGATTNAQARGLAAAPGARFLHVELSDVLRPRLVADGALSRSFATAIVKSLRSAGQDGPR